MDAVRAAGLRVIPIPGTSAGIAALSASGLVQDTFHFAGFLPAKSGQRDTVLQTLRGLTSTLIFYEAPHRIVDTVSAMARCFEPDRLIVFGRELTKLFEEIHRCRLDEAAMWLAADIHREKGEFVVMLQGATAERDRDAIEGDRVLTILMAECPLKQAAALAAQITGQKKNALYERALQIKAENN